MEIILNGTQVYAGVVTNVLLSNKNGSYADVVWDNDIPPKHNKTSKKMFDKDAHDWKKTNVGLQLTKL